MHRLALAVLIAASSPTAQQPAAQSLRLTEGSRWDYVVHTRLGSSEDPPGVRVLTHVAEADFGLADGSRCTPIRTRTASGTSSWPLFYAVRDGAISCYRATDDSRRGDIDFGAEPSLLLARGAEVGHRWSWDGTAEWIQGSGEVWHHEAELMATAATIRVRAGTFATTRVRITSERAGDDPETAHRDLWFAADVGIVRDETRSREWIEVRELDAFTAGRSSRADREHRIRTIVELQDHAMVAAGRPWITWIDDLPAAARLPGRIAVAKGNGATHCYYVDDEVVLPFAPGNRQSLIPIVRRAFHLPSAASAVPPVGVPVEDLALLLAHTHAERCNLGNVRQVGPTTSLPNLLPVTTTRVALVEVTGGAPDGTNRRVTVLLELGKQAALQIDTDADGPKPAAQ